MRYLFKLGHAVFSVLMLLWFFYSIYFVFQYLNIDLMNVTNSKAKLLVGITVLSFALLVCKIFKFDLIKFIYNWLVSHKKTVFIIMLLFQLIILLTSIGLAAADTTIVYAIATDNKFAASTDYISIYPNNYLLVQWIRLNYLLFAKNTVVVLGLWNIIFIDIAISLNYFSAKQMFKNKVTDNVYLLLVLIIGFSPQYIYTYSDPITFFFISLFIWYSIKLIKNDTKLWQWVILGILIAVAYGLRPTVMIYVIAAIIVFTFYVLSSKIKLTKQVLMQVLVLFLSLFVFNSSVNFVIKHQNRINFEAGYKRTLLYYVDLGLTYAGNEHAAIPEEVSSATGSARNSEAKKDIQHRLSEYNSATFVGHMYFKYYWMVGEGMFGWFQEKVLSEETRLNIPWLNRIQDSKIARLVRTYVYANGENYFFYALAIQVIWILISFGLVRFINFYSEDNWYQLWMQITLFGGLLFLMIFEAGRSRYLIQFLPPIIFISAVGLTNLKQGLILKEEKNEITT